MDARAHFEAAAARHRAGDLAGAEAGYRAAIRLKPDAAPAHRNLIAALRGLERHEAVADALVALAAVEDDDLTHLAAAEALLAVGRYAEAWPHFERRPPLANIPVRAAKYPEWRGEPLAGRSILVWGEQGLGDQIQFARFLPWLREQGAAEIVVATHPALVRLFRRLPVDAVISQLGDVAAPACDYWVSLLSLAHRRGATLDMVAAPPLFPTAHRPRPGQRRVGVVWKGGDLFPRNAPRSLPDATALDPLKAAGVTLVDLQTPQGDMADSLHRLAELDLLVTVDTSWAHLAGAAGLPAWVMLPRPHLCWRWGLTGDAAPWYPGLRLFRQETPGDWDGVVARVADALKEGA